MSLFDDLDAWQEILLRHPPLTFRELAEGDTFIAFPEPGDDSGHGGFRGATYLFKKLTPTSCVHLVDDVMCSDLGGMLVLKVLSHSKKIVCNTKMKKDHP